MIASVDLLEFCKFFMFVTWMAASKHSGADTMVHLETAMLLVDILHATDQHSSAITYLRPAMRKLLEPLCYLHNIGLVIIDGPAPKLYLETVTQRIKRRAPSVQEMVQSMSSLIEQGDAAFLGGVFDVAALRYETALNQLHAGSHRREKFEMIIEGKYTGIIIGKVKAMLEYQLHLSLAKTNLQLQRYAMAHHWTIIVVHGRKAPDQEIAQMWYHRALASKGMGELHRAYQEMRKARLKRPDDVMIQAELAGLANHLALRRQDTVAV